MEIRSLIDYNYYCVSILEDMDQIAEWLQEHDYYAVVDEDNQTVGIITATDCLLNRNHQLVNCNLNKPGVTPGTAVADAYRLMEQHKLNCLPVSDNNCFVGVISLWALAATMMKTIDEMKSELHVQ